MVDDMSKRHYIHTYTPGPPQQQPIRMRHTEPWGESESTQTWTWKERKNNNKNKKYLTTTTPIQTEPNSPDSPDINLNRTLWERTVDTACTMGFVLKIQMSWIFISWNMQYNHTISFFHSLSLSLSFSLSLLGSVGWIHSPFIESLHFGYRHGLWHPYHTLNGSHAHCDRYCATTIPKW